VTTRDLVEIVLKTLAGGFLVVVFALVSEVVRPKTFAGVFAAAPAVALAGLVVSGVAKGNHDVKTSTAGMIAGGAAIVAYCLLVVRLHPRLDALRASSAALVGWLSFAAIFYYVVVG
jgi:uncharacterized membrane protein (GlpM family)